MKKTVLANGITVLYEAKKTKAVSIQVMVGVGSNDEVKGERGIAHMVEHLVFEGTQKRETSQIIANEIESLGGEFNAYTTNWRTCYYIKILAKHAQKALAILSDMLQHSLFREKDFDRERNVVLKEIDMMHDDPKSHGWLTLEEKLFSKNNCRYPSYGDPKDLMKMTRDDVFSFFNKHYVASNLTISICGDVSSYSRLVQKEFGSFREGKVSSRSKVLEKPLVRNISLSEKKPYSSSYVLCAFRGPTRGSKDSYVLDVVSAILGKGQSGKLFHEIRGKRGLAYEVGVEFNSDKDFGYFVVFASCSLKNVPKVQKLIFAELEKLKHGEFDNLELKDAVNFLEGDFLMDLDDPQKVADQMLYWHDTVDVSEMNTYVRKVKCVTSADIKRVSKKYFTKRAMIVLKGK